MLRERSRWPCHSYWNLLVNGVVLYEVNKAVLSYNPFICVQLFLMARVIIPVPWQPATAVLQGDTFASWVGGGSWRGYMGLWQGVKVHDLKVCIASMLQSCFVAQPTRPPCLQYRLQLVAFWGPGRDFFMPSWLVIWRVGVYHLSYNVVQWIGELASSMAV